MKLNLMILLAVIGLLFGCASTENSGNSPDPVKIEKTKAIIKPMVSSAVLGVVQKNPDLKETFQHVADGICLMQSEGDYSLSGFQRLVNLAFANHPKRVDPYVMGAVNTIVAIFELYYAERFNANVSPNEYVDGLLEVLCQGINQGIIMSGV